jgi:peroxiredoxin (alkyl hydroperoxide reductase subunit C)
MNVGRSVEELLRLVCALQTADREICSTPEGWQPGGPLLESAAVTVEQAIADGRANTAWYFRERQT